MDFMTLSFFYGKGKKGKFGFEKNSKVSNSDDSTQREDIETSNTETSFIQPKSTDSRKRKSSSAGTNQRKKTKYKLKTADKSSLEDKCKQNKKSPECSLNKGESQNKTFESNKFFKNSLNRLTFDKKPCYKGVNVSNKNKRNSRFPLNFLKASHVNSSKADHGPMVEENSVNENLPRSCEMDVSTDDKTTEDGAMDCQNVDREVDSKIEASPCEPTSAEKKRRQFTQLKFAGNSMSLVQPECRSAGPDPSQEQTPQSSCRSFRSSLIRSKEKSQQMLLDFGQKIEGPVQCNICNLTYNTYEKSDEKFHAKYHKKCLSILKYKISSKDRILQSFLDGGMIVVLRESEGSQAKVREIKEHVDSELGFVTEASHPAVYQVFLYIKDNQVIGFCMAQSIKWGYRMVSSAVEDARRDVEIVETGMGRESLSGGLPFCCSTIPEPAKCGINRIWVLRRERRSGVATKLLDAIRNHFVFGHVLDKRELAFSDPTTDGTAFASKYAGSPDFLVYSPIAANIP